MKKQLKSYAIIALGAVIFALAFDWFFAANAVGMVASQVWRRPSMSCCRCCRWVF